MKGYIGIVAFLFFYCEPQTPNISEQAEVLLQKEKYAKAVTLLENHLSFGKKPEQILSPPLPPESPLRKVELTHSRKILVWSENQNLFFWEETENKIQKKEFPYKIHNFSVSSQGQMVAVLHKHSDAKTCKLSAYSFSDPSLVYESQSYLKCDTSFAISPGGDALYYFQDSDLYMEKTVVPKESLRIGSENSYAAPFPKLEHRFYLSAFGSDLLVFSGNAGSYSLTHYNANRGTFSSLSKEILSPILVLEDTETAYVYSGKIGETNIQTLQNQGGRVYLTKPRAFPFGMIPAQRFGEKDQFLSLTKSQPKLLQVAKLGTKRQELPFSAERIWALDSGKIVFENKKGELGLVTPVFSESEKQVLDLFKKARKLWEAEGL